MSLEEILKEICSQRLQKQVYMILHSVVMEDYDSIADENREHIVSLTAINKINKGKNEAIDALSDLNNKDAHSKQKGAMNDEMETMHG